MIMGKKLTGKIRYRSSWFGSKLILQVQIEVNCTDPRDMTDYQYNGWRDATITDLAKIINIQIGE